MAKKRPNDRVSRPDEENPEWTKEDFARARPAAEVLLKFIGEKATQELMRRSRGRPPKADKKVNQTLRMDADVLEAYRQEGKGWQTRINEVLRQHMPQRPR
ncbi:MAG TPA: BrnA antitoxin family protein [Candidatus Binataceae bacterium]|nr:BrnA antitoxin family protein [Candidatus Binataceae bacterium]